MKLLDLSREDSRIYCLVAGFLLLFIGPLVKYPPAYDYVIVKNLTGFLFCILLSASYIMGRKSFGFNRNTFIPFLLFSAWILFTALKAPFKHGAARQLEEYILYFMIFACAMNVRMEKRWIYFWASSGFIASLIAIFQYFGNLRYPVSMFGNPNFFAGHLMMPLIISFAAALSPDFEKNEKKALCAFLAAGFFALLLVKSRAAIFSTFFGISTVMCLSTDKSNPLRKWGGYAVLFLAVALMLPTIRQWFLTNVRIFLWKGTVEMIKKNPLAGWGLGNFVFFYPYFRIKEYFLHPESTPTTTHAHNEYLHICSETGIVGLLLFIAVAGSAIFFLARKLRRDSSGDILFMGVVGSLVAVLADNIFSTNMRNPSTSMYFWFLLGISAGKRINRETGFDFSRILWYTILIVSLAMAVFTSFYRILPEVYLKRGIWARESGDVKGAIDNYLMVSSINPYNYISRYKLAYAYGEAGMLEESRRTYLEIHRKIFPNFAKLNSNLGTVYLMMGQPEKALYHYGIEEKLNPYDVDVLCSTASIYFIYRNDVKKGLGYIKKVIDIDPGNKYAENVIKMLKKEGKI